MLWGPLAEGLGWVPCQCEDTPFSKEEKLLRAVLPPKGDRSRRKELVEGTGQGTGNKGKWERSSWSFPTGPFFCHQGTAAGSIRPCPKGSPMDHGNYETNHPLLFNESTSTSKGKHEKARALSPYTHPHPHPPPGPHACPATPTASLWARN